MPNPNLRPTNSNISDTYKQHYANSEELYWATIEKLIKEEKISIRDVLKNYPSFIRRRDLPRLLAHYELFQMVRDVPGSIVELGVYLGAGTFTFGKLLETFCPGDRTRKVYGFDTFEGYKVSNKVDLNSANWISESIGDKKSNLDLMNELTYINNLDNILTGVERTIIIPGDINETVPKFANEPDGLRISLLYFDANLYESTLVGLKHLYPLVIKGGVVAFNAYGIPPWEGETGAFDEFFSDKEKPILKRMEFSNIPSAYFIKNN